MSSGKLKLPAPVTMHGRRSRPAPASASPRRDAAETPAGPARIGPHRRRGHSTATGSRRSISASSRSQVESTRSGVFGRQAGRSAAVSGRLPIGRRRHESPASIRHQRFDAVVDRQSILVLLLAVAAPDDRIDRLRARELDRDPAAAARRWKSSCGSLPYRPSLMWTSRCFGMSIASRRFRLRTGSRPGRRSGRPSSRSRVHRCTARIDCSRSWRAP